MTKREMEEMDRICAEETLGENAAHRAAIIERELNDKKVKRIAELHAELDRVRKERDALKALVEEGVERFGRILENGWKDCSWIIRNAEWITKARITLHGAGTVEARLNEALDSLQAVLILHCCKRANGGRLRTRCVEPMRLLVAHGRFKIVKDTGATLIVERSE